MDNFLILMLLGIFVVGRIVSKHPRASGAVAKGIFQSLFRK